jgi:hypothetical protein
VVSDSWIHFGADALPGQLSALGSLPLTFWALKMDKSSLKSSNIRFLYRVGREGDLRNRPQALMGGQRLPGLIFFHPESTEVRILADHFVDTVRL